ncbi:hypothetical protein AAG906_022997 [Vitis piasezkii]
MMSEPAYTAGPSSQPSFIEPPHTETSPHQTLHAPDHAPWMDLSAQISSLGTSIEELAVVSDTRFYSMDDRKDQYQTGFTSQFDSRLHLIISSRGLSSLRVTRRVSMRT